MARKSPLNKLQETVVGTVKGAITHPVESAEKAVEQAKGTISVGRMVAGQVTKSAAGAVAHRLPGRKSGTAAAPVRPADEPLRAVPTQPAPTAETEAAAPAPSPASKPTAPKPTAPKPTAPKPTAKKAPVKKATTKAPAKKATAKKTTPTPTRVPVSDLATEAVKKQAANQPVKQPSPAPTTSIDAAADPAHVEATPADVAKKATPRKPGAPAATKAPAKKSAATKAASSPGAKLPAKKAAPADADRA